MASSTEEVREGVEKLPQQVASAPEEEPKSEEEERPQQEGAGVAEEPASNGAASELDAPSKEGTEKAEALPEHRTTVEQSAADEPASGSA